MEKKIIVEVFKRAWKAIIVYLQAKLLDKVKAGALKAFEAFKKVLWEEIKDDVYFCAKEAVEQAEIFLTSEEAAEKEEIVLKVVMDFIKFPVILKPFKGIVKKLLKTKIEETVKLLLSKSKEMLN